MYSHGWYQWALFSPPTFLSTGLSSLQSPPDWGSHHRWAYSFGVGDVWWLTKVSSVQCQLYNCTETKRHVQEAAGINDFSGGLQFAKVIFLNTVRVSNCSWNLKYPGRFGDLQCMQWIPVSAVECDISVSAQGKWHLRAAVGHQGNYYLIITQL